MSGITEFVKRDTYEKVMFGWVMAIRMNMPSVTVKQAIENFMKHNNLTEEDVNIYTLTTTYNRMTKEYYQNK